MMNSSAPGILIVFIYPAFVNRELRNDHTSLPMSVVLEFEGVLFPVVYAGAVAAFFKIHSFLVQLDTPKFTFC